MSDTIVILGRGKSLIKLKDTKINCNEVILVNSFWDDKWSPKAYYKDELIDNFIKDKRLTLFASGELSSRLIDGPIGSFVADFTKIEPFLNKYNVANCFLTKFRKITRIGKEHSIFKLLPDKLINPYIKNGEHGSKCDSLSIAIEYAIHILKKKKIIIYGLDFYEHDYYLPQSHDYKRHVKSSNIKKENWKKFLNHYSKKNISFDIFTLANFKMTNSNITIN